MARWRCFHCNDVFPDRQAAEGHFGKYETDTPACLIAPEHIRWLEAQHRKACEEDREVLRTMTGIITEHERLRREAEELGYARGLKDNALSLADPDYARIYTKTRVAAWSYGYACMLHGSGTRDLDLFLYPWEKQAEHHSLQSLVEYVAEINGLKMTTPSEKLYGRKSWTLLFPDPMDNRWVDISGYEL